MFLGQYEHSLDDKGRVTLPARFRAALERGVVVTRGLDGCLWVFTLEKWDEVAAKIDSLPWTQRGGRNFVRLMFSGAVDASPDKQGRIRIPDYLLKYAGISSEVVILGLNSKMEIWAGDRWTEQQATVEEDPEGLAEQLYSLGIM